MKTEISIQHKELEKFQTGQWFIDEKDRVAILSKVNGMFCLVWSDGSYTGFSDNIKDIYSLIDELKLEYIKSVTLNLS